MDGPKGFTFLMILAFLPWTLGLVFGKQPGVKNYNAHYESRLVSACGSTKNSSETKTETKTTIETLSTSAEDFNSSESWRESSRTKDENANYQINNYMERIVSQLSLISRELVKAVPAKLIEDNEKKNEDEDIDGARKFPSYPIATDCESLMNSGAPSGVYQLSRDFLLKMDWIWNVFEVYCDQSVGGGWTVIQRRGGPFAGMVNFARSWDEYAKGFGDIEGEFWLGNEWIYRLTTLFGPYELRIELEDWDCETAWVQYSDFAIYRNGDNYQLLVGGYTGNATDSLSIPLHSTPNYFSTYDRRNDQTNNFKLCASTIDGGWWYNSDCPFTNLNGHYYEKSQDRKPHAGIVWEGWHDNSSLKSTKMMIRSKYYRSLNMVNAKNAQQKCPH